MSRVWKRFFFKIGKALAIIVSAISTIVGLTVFLYWMGMTPDAAMLTSLTITIIIPMIFIILKHVYEDEIHRENRNLMRSLGDKN